MEYVWKNRTAGVLVSRETVRRIRIGVVIGHAAAVILPLALATVLAWFPDKEERITVMLYDPSLDNVVENPSPDPAPDNPVPPSGTPDAGPAAPALPPPPDPPSPTTAPPQPKVKPLPKVAPQLPKRVNIYQQTRVDQPKVKPMVRKPPTPASRPKPAEPKTAAADPRRTVDDVTPVKPGAGESSETGTARKSGPRGSNSEAGHNAPGGQRGNSGYEIQIALMIERMWVTPESVRLGGREPRVLIELHIDPTGLVTGKRIKTRSGVLAMDESVAALLDSLHRVKAPYDGKSHTLTFWLKAKRD